MKLIVNSGDRRYMLDQIQLVDEIDKKLRELQQTKVTACNELKRFVAQVSEDQPAILDVMSINRNKLSWWLLHAATNDSTPVA